MASDLTQLRDIHLPASISWWPLAPGWYLLALIIALLCLMLGFLLHRQYSNGRAKHEALRTLAMYQQEYKREANSQLFSSQISELLRRVALAYYPRVDVAGLHGDLWINFLNTTIKGVNFNSVRTHLLELPYRPHGRDDVRLGLSADYDRIQPLFSMARKWISRQGKPCLN